MYLELKNNLVAINKTVQHVYYYDSDGIVWTLVIKYYREQNTNHVIEYDNKTLMLADYERIKEILTLDLNKESEDV